MNIDLMGYLHILRRRWWALAMGLAAGLAAGYLALSFLGLLPVYSATVTILVPESGSTTSSDRYGTLVLTYAELTRQDIVTQAVVKNLGLSISGRQLAEMIDVSVIPETRLVQITVTHQDPQVAANIANELALQMSSLPWIRGIRLEVLSAAMVPGLPDLGPYINVLLAGMLGLFLAGGLVFMGESLGDRVRETTMTASHLEVPVLGTLSRRADKTAQAIWPLVELCTQLGEGSHRRILITSPRSREGKSTLALLLADAWTRTGRTAILVDAHVQYPVLHERLGCSNDAGLTGWLLSPGEEIPLCTVSDRLALLSSGPVSTDPAAVLASQQWPAALTALDGQADIVIIDAPPVLPAAEITLLAPKMDGVLLVLRAGRTKLAAAGEALEALGLVDSPVLGLVLNRH